MSWLIGYTIASIVGAVFVVRLFDYVFGGFVSTISSIARGSLFVSVWTAITTALGMHDFSKTERKLRRSSEEVSRRVNRLQKVNGFNRKERRF